MDVDRRRAVVASAFRSDAMTLCAQLSELGFREVAYAADGFEVKGELSGFEVAGEDKIFVPAKAELCKEKIFVSATEVEQPLYARYLWTNYGRFDFAQSI